MTTTPVKQTVTLTVNGQEYTREVPTYRTLVDFIRYDLGLTGTKEACSVGVCGACTIELNGRITASCITLAVRADGTEITTIEGVADGDTLHPVQEAFINYGGFQCGACTPGQIMAAKALLEHNPSPTLDRKIRSGEVEVVREGRRVYVRMQGPDYLSDAALLRRAVAREQELERTVRQLEQNVSELKLSASELERERDEARESASASRRPYQELERAYQKEVAAHKETNELFIAVRVAVFVLLALLIASVLLWWFVLR